MTSAIPDFTAKSKNDQNRLGTEGALRLLDAGRQWDLAPVLRSGGSIIFPHATIDVCGHQIAAAVHACLDSGTSRIVVLGVLHARTAELDTARRRVAEGADPASEAAWGIQGPGMDGRQDWMDEFSLSHFEFLWRIENERRGGNAPEPLARYPFLAGGNPERMPGIGRLQRECEGAVTISTMDPFHHGIGYGDGAETAIAPNDGGLDLARDRILEGFRILKSGGYAAFQRHCVDTKSDGRDVGQVLRFLRGPMDAQLVDLLADDMAPVYSRPSPTWVAGGLITLTPADTVSGARQEVCTGG